MSVSGGSGLQSSSLESFIVITRRKIATNSGFWKGMGGKQDKKRSWNHFEHLHFIHINGVLLRKRRCKLTSVSFEVFVS